MVHHMSKLMEEGFNLCVDKQWLFSISSRIEVYNQSNRYWIKYSVNSCSRKQTHCCCMVEFVWSWKQIHIKITKYLISFWVSNFKTFNLFMPNRCVFYLLKLKSQQILINLHNWLLNMWYWKILFQLVFIYTRIDFMLHIQIIRPVPRKEFCCFIFSVLLF